ncbi:RNase A-like domain-containing protein [Rhodopila sp.]|uniref:RNase A-like domain-containing protein n=1 Tax=Rhodopila sp. TaxID=2480087 RepID=UPI002B905D0E|nr:RNase A-like domain-containing protein [Rhodopila sp.]HVZ09624.1 RNase A-like domain-containing protein [Rhodopila sp.]
MTIDGLTIDDLTIDGLTIDDLTIGGLTIDDLTIDGTRNADMSQAGIAEPPAAEADGTGLRIVLTPIQLAAIMGSETITAPENHSGRLMTRLVGGAELVGGALELIGAGALFLAPEPTMLTKAGGAVLGTNGLDNVGTGLYQLWTGWPRTTLTEQAATELARKLGTSPHTAHNIGVAIDIAVPLAVAGAIGAVRALSIRRGLIVLLEEEEAGGHTILKHVAKDDEFLLNRLTAEPRIPAAGSFASVRDAERAISDAIKANRTAITQWAASGATRDLPFSVHLGRDVGTTILRGSSSRITVQSVRLVLRRTTINQKLYFVLTAYPVP